MFTVEVILDDVHSWCYTWRCSQLRLYLTMFTIEVILDDVHSWCYTWRCSLLRL